MRRIGQELPQRRLEEIGHLLEVDLARRQQAADCVGQAVPLRHGESDPLVAQPLGPAPAGQRMFDAEKGRALVARFGRHAACIAQEAGDGFPTSAIRRARSGPRRC
jgi:hypothetical protein